jgi:manganese/zinc/iron transport system permease protein
MTVSFRFVAEIAASDAWTQMVRFWSFRDASVRTVIAGVLLLGVSCGTLGCFIVLRRLSLMGDSLGHAVLPGVCLGFLVNKTKDPLWIFVGAVLSALLGSWIIGVIQRKSRLKPDAAMGLVLSGFFGLGVVLLTRFQNFSYGNQSGLNQFLFGQASAIRERDLWLIGAVGILIVVTVLLAFKELAITSFDEGFAASIGIPATVIHYLLMTLTAFAVVISIQAVGVVLLSALLITPAATALLLTERLKSMVLLSIVLACLGAVIGVNLSFLGRDFPTGPFIVVILTAFFIPAYLFSPRHGVLSRRFRHWRQSLKTRRENRLKSLYFAIFPDEERPADRTVSSPAERLVEPAGDGSGISISRLAAALGETESACRRSIAPLVRKEWAAIDQNVVRLTPRGLHRARELVRNYRLWELFLTHEINIPYDHTQRDAEDIEHILGPQIVEELERKYASELH